MGSFKGFPREALGFLEELEANNDGDWFRANRDRYEHLLAEPARALGEELADLGRPHLFRPWNNMRFHRGPPLKEHVGLAVGYEGAGGYYVELSLDGLLVAGGLHRPARDQLERIRRAVDGERSSGDLRAAVERARRAGLSLNEPELSRAPRGYPADHPRLELLRRRRLIVAQRHPLAGWLHQAAAMTRIRTQLEAATPLVSWLREHVGPSSNGDGRAPTGRTREGER